MDEWMSNNQEMDSEEYERFKEIMEKLTKSGFTGGFESIIDKNSAFQAKSNRTKINQNELHKIMKGDHIGFHRPRIIWHHIIVTDVDEKNNRLEVIHYAKMGYCFQIVQEWINVKDQEGDLYVFNYNRKVLKMNPPDVVLRRANELLGSKEYRLLENNCEHFASKCKTGDPYSYQVRWMNRKVKVSLWTGSFLTIGEVVTAMVGTEYWYILFGAVLLEAVHCAYDIHRQNKARKCKRMTERDFKVSVTQRVVEAVCGAIFAIVGHLLVVNERAQNTLQWILGQVLSVAPWIIEFVVSFLLQILGIILWIARLLLSVAPSLIGSAVTSLLWVAEVTLSIILGTAGAFAGKAFGSMVGGLIGERLW